MANSVLLEEVAVCPVCGSGTHTPWLTTHDYAATNQPFTIQQCVACGFRFTSPRPSAETIGSYYDFSDYLSHSEQENSLTSKVYYLARQYAVRWKLRLVAPFKPRASGALLDYGCGTGVFAQAAQQAGWNVRGVEPNVGARSLADARLGGNSSVVVDLNALAADQTFDVIALWHVLEHVHTLNETLRDLVSRLKPAGRLVIAVPNVESPDAHHYGGHWAALDVPRHLYHFSAIDIQRLAARHGGQVVAEKPMYLDALYISLLSERFRRGWAPTAIWQGIKSNLQAFRHRNTSSKVYVLAFD